MKNISVLLILLLILPLVSAVDINLKQEFKPGETMLANIEANILTPIKVQDIYFYSGRVQIPILFDVARIGDISYIYAQLPLTERNYTIVIKNLHFYENGIEQVKDIKKDFQVAGNVTDFSVSPGFIIATGDFSISIESKNKKIELQTTFLEEEKTVEVPAGQKKKILFSHDLKNFTVTQLELSALNTVYSIPVAIIPKNDEAPENLTIIKSFRFNKDEFEFEVRVGEERTFSIYLQNLGDSKIEDIKIFVSNELKDIIQVSPEEMDLEAGESNKTLLIIDADDIDEFEGKIYADSENFSTSSDLIIISKDEDEEIAPVEEDDICIIKNGFICESGYTCSVSVVKASDTDECCINGSCDKKKSYTGTIIGIVLLLAVAGAVVFLYLRSKKKPESAEEIIKKKTESYKYGEVKS